MSDPAVDHCGRRLHSLWLCALYKRSLYFACRQCPHEGLISAIPVWWLFKRKGWSEALGDVAVRFYCSHCLAERQRKVRGPKLAVSLDEAPPCDLALPDQREWKRMVSRYRG
jgi:hypothetical protein